VPTANALSAHKSSLSLGVKSISESEAEALSTHKGELELYSLKKLEDLPGHLNLVAKLIQNKAAIDLEDLEELSDGAAEILGKFKGELNLSGLQSISDASGLGLAAHNGELHLNGLKSISKSVAGSIEIHKGQVNLDESVYVEMDALIPEYHKIEIGIVPTDPPRYKGVSKFKILWELDGDLIERHGYDIDNGTASVTYDFATGKASDFQILEELVEKGLAVPYLDSVITIESAFANDDSTVWKWEQGQMETEIVDFTGVKLGEIIRRVHAHGLELLKK
jgi:hypothetical protein